MVSDLMLIHFLVTNSKIEMNTFLCCFWGSSEHHRRHLLVHRPGRKHLYFFTNLNRKKKSTFCINQKLDNKAFCLLLARMFLDILTSFSVQVPLSQENKTKGMIQQETVFLFKQFKRMLLLSQLNVTFSQLRCYNWVCIPYTLQYKKTKFMLIIAKNHTKGDVSELSSAVVLGVCTAYLVRTYLRMVFS